MTMKIPLTQGQFALVDDDMFEQLNQYKWFAHKRGRVFYAERSVRIAKNKQKNIIMHNIIIDVPPGFVCDHIDHNGLNNQRSNLRAVTNRQNCQNHSLTYTSKYPGVVYYKRTGRWMAQAYNGQNNRYLGYFDTEKQAFEAYCSAIASMNETVIGSGVKEG